MSVKIVSLPGLSDKGDLFDFIEARRGTDPAGIRAEIEALVHAAEPWAPTADTANAGALPMVLLPCTAQTISAAGESFGRLLSDGGTHFLRGGTVVKVSHDSDGLPVLDEVRPAALASDFETVAQPSKVVVRKTDGEERAEEVPAVCTEQTAKVIAHAESFRRELPPIHVVTRCPVLIERGGRLVEIAGYDRESGICSAGGETQSMPLDEARDQLHNVLSDFRFASPADKTRALAAIITPALVLSGLLGGRAPIDLGEADNSQSGKGYRNKLTAAMYCQSVKAITQKAGGVGSLEESFNMALIRGANMISLDNVKGKLDSPAIESFLTEDTYTARAPYREPVEIDPRRVVVMLTSNKADMTTDLANRSSCVRILKQKDGYQFKAYPEGDILDHVRANQSRYLGAVFAVVRAWYEAGKPRTTETRHDFRRWAQALDWITQHLLDAGPLMDGHRETQHRMTNPQLNWLRDIAIDVIHAGHDGRWLRASDLLERMEDDGHLPPGLKEDADLTDDETRKRALQAIGRKMAACFRAGDSVLIDNMAIERRTEHDEDNRRDIKTYRFKSAPIDSGLIGANPETDGEKSGTPGTENTKNGTENTGCAYECAYSAPKSAPKKSLCAPNAPRTLLIGKHFDEGTPVAEAYIPPIGPSRRIGANQAQTDLFDAEDSEPATAMEGDI
jgi:hypothetical protein